MSLSRLLQKADLYTEKNALQEAYSNDGLPDTVTSLGSSIDYIISSMFPNARPSVATEADLPTGVDTPNAGDAVPALNDYRIVDDYNSTGQAAGYRWTQLEGQPAPVWNLVQMFDSMDSILQQWETNAAGLFALQLGVEDVAGQEIHGSTLANGNLLLSANSGDGTNDPALQTGHINIFSNMKPLGDDAFDLGTSAERFASIYLSGNISDGTASLTVAQALAAYTHSQVTSGNPHSVAYAELLNRFGNVTIDGDVTSTVIDFSTGGAKTFTLSITDDSHNHTVSTITDFDDATWANLKGSLTDGGGVTWSFDDGLKQATAAITIDTSGLQDVATPAVNKVLASNAAGDEWIASDGTVELTGDVSGSATYSSATDKVSVNSTVDNVAIQNIDRLNIANLTAVCDTSNPTQITLNNHGLIDGRKVRLFGFSFDNEYAVSVIDINTFSIPVDNSAGIVENGYIIPDGSQFLYDSILNEWCVKLEFSQISHYELSDLSADDHSQYHNINGRTDGTNNPVTGGELSGANLFLESTSHATKGQIRFKDNLVPATGASYSGGWSGTDLGSASLRIRDIFMRGIISNLRIESVGSLPAATIEDKGRMVLLNGGDVYITKDGITYSKLIDSTSELIGAVVYKGVWNADTNVPDLTSINTKGHYYVVNVAGATNLDGITDWKETDVAIHNGTTWEKIDNTDSVLSVNGETGIVVLDTSDIAENTNLYYTDARAIAAAKTVWEQEAPSGLINASNVTYVLSATPQADKAVQLYLNGLIQRQGTDYTISGLTITMITAPAIGQDLYAIYDKG